jgi:hypothetical protein
MFLAQPDRAATVSRPAAAQRSLDDLSVTRKG